MAEAVAFAASIIAIVQITKSTIDLVTEIYYITRNQRVSCPEFDQYTKRLEQVHKRAEELSEKEGSTITRKEYADVQQWLQKCRDFLQGLIQEGKIAKYLNSGKAATRFEKYHRMIDQCYTILSQRSIDRIEEKMGVYHVSLVEKIDDLLNRIPANSTSLQTASHVNTSRQASTSLASNFDGQDQTLAPAPALADPSYRPPFYERDQYLEPDSYGYPIMYTDAPPEDTLSFPPRRQTAPDIVTTPKSIPPALERSRDDSGYWTVSTHDPELLSGIRPPSRAEYPNLYDGSAQMGLGPDHRGSSSTRSTFSYGSLNMEARAGSIKSTVSYNNTDRPSNIPRDRYPSDSYGTIAQDFAAFSFNNNNSTAPSDSSGSYQVSDFNTQVSPQQSVSSTAGILGERTLTILCHGKRQFHLSSGVTGQSEQHRRIEWFSSRDSIGIIHDLPSDCLPRIDKKNLADGFKYRLFFACVGHIIHVQSESLSNDKLAYFFRSKTECKQFFRQLTWPATIAVFDTARISYLGGKDPPVTLRSLLILRKEHPSDLSPTMTFTLRLEKEHRTFTHRIREFLPEAEATEEKYPELTLRFSSKASGLSRKSKRKVEVLYRGLLHEKINIHRDALIIQFPGVSVLDNFLDACNKMHLLSQEAFGPLLPVTLSLG